MSFGFAPRTASAYAQVSLETGVSDADPHKLILMLFEGCLWQDAITTNFTTLAIGCGAMIVVGDHLRFDHWRKVRR